MDFARYYEAVRYLEQRLWRELPILPVERTLQARVRTLLGHFGDPHRAMPVVHVGGSAGKGSTATMIASILRTAGLRAGLYTSPHLQTFIERIDVNGELIAPETFAELVLGLDPLVRKMHIDVLDGDGFGRPSLVEVAFAVGMKHFADERCDVAVIEVGLGGRTDCTNVFDDPIPKVTVLTNVELEHRERLGPTIGAIAREKADIIRGGVVITGARRRDALNVIEARCRETGAELWRLGREVRVGVGGSDVDGTCIDVSTPRGRVQKTRLAMAGAHQARNAALAAAAALACGGGVDEAALREGLGAARSTGRLEIVQQSPRVILDSAHNPVEARALAATLSAHWLRPDIKLHLVVGILADKDQSPMVRALASVADSVVVTQPPLGERTGDPRRMLDGFAAALGERNVIFEPAPERALDLALEHAADDDVVCVTGSMFLVGALRGRWVPEERILRRRSAVLS